MRTMILALVGLTTACTTDTDTDAIETDTGVDTSTEETGSEETGSEETGTEDTAPPAELALIGDWIDDWGTDVVITADAVIFPWATQTIHSFDNEAESLLAVDASGETDVWYRYDWTMQDGTFWFCTAVFDGTSAEDAAGRADSDRAAYDADGCGGFAFSQLLEPVAIRGSWTLPEDISLEVTKTTWTASEISGSIAAWSNDEQYVVVNYSTDFMITDQHIRRDWVVVDDETYLCETSVEPGTLAEAEALSRPDHSGPSTGGCHDNPWTLMSPTTHD